MFPFVCSVGDRLFIHVISANWLRVMAFINGRLKACFVCNKASMASAFESRKMLVLMHIHRMSESLERTYVLTEHHFTSWNIYILHTETASGMMKDML